MAAASDQMWSCMAKRIVNIEDFRRRAQRRLPRMVFDFLEGGALDELTVRANLEQLQALPLRQRCLVDVSDTDTATTVLGQELSLPLLVSPMGMLTALHPSS